MSIYSQFGVPTILNAAGPLTRLGGAMLPDAVVEAMRQAAREAVPIEALQAAASLSIARSTGTEAGLVTSGASAALTLGATAILARLDFARMTRLPDTSGYPNQFLIARDQRNGYDHAVRAAGAVLIDVGFNELHSGAGVRRIELADYEMACTDQTAGILYVYRDDASPPLRELVEWARSQQLPVLVDAAAELPPRQNLRAIPATGADLVAFSGGKAIRGPQNSGILCGDEELIQSATLQMLDMDEHPNLWTPPKTFGSREQRLPRHGIGRGFKVAKEQIVGLLVALELFTNGQHDESARMQRVRLEKIASKLAAHNLPHKIRPTASPELSPSLEIQVDPGRASGDAFDVCRQLRAGDPPIYVNHANLHQGCLVLDLSALREEYDELLTSRLLAALDPIAHTVEGKRS